MTKRKCKSALRVPAHIRAVVTPSINEWNGRSAVQLQVQHWEPVK